MYGMAMWRGPLVVQTGRLCFNFFTGGRLVSTSAVGERKAGRGAVRWDGM